MTKDNKAVVVAAASGLVAGLVANQVRKQTQPYLPPVAVAIVGAAVFVLVRSVVSDGLSGVL